MNQITLPAAELKQALSGLSKVVSRKTTLPVLSTIKLARDQQGKVSLSATDLDAFVTYNVEQLQPGSFRLVLGDALAQSLGVTVGSDVVLIAPRGSVTPAGFAPTMRRFRVSGLFHSGMYEYDQAYIYVDLRTAQRFAAIGSDVTGIEVRTADRGDASRVADTVRSTLRTPVRAMDWQEQNSQLFKALKLEKLGMSVILLLIVVVAAFNIVSTLTMVVADKTREIGILRTMGMRARSIRRIFLLQGVVVGAVGTAGGLLLGLGVSVLLERYQLIALDPSVYFIDHLPVYTELGDVVLIVAASLAIAALATLYPASQAAKLYPVEAIRHE